MIKSLLSGPEVANKKGDTPKKLVIFLHGLGADGNNLIDIADYFQEQLPETYFISPNAPYEYDMDTGGVISGYQWFSFLDRSETAILKGIVECAPILNIYIDQCKERFNLEYKDIVLVGFSQGTMMALYVALRRKQPLGGVIGFSGALLGANALTPQDVSKLPVLLIHGDHDDVVPYQNLASATDKLRNLGIMVSSYTCEGLGHSIDLEGLKVAAHFLARNFMSAGKIDESA